MVDLPQPGRPGSGSPAAGGSELTGPPGGSTEFDPVADRLRHLVTRVHLVAPGPGGHAGEGRASRIQLDTSLRRWFNRNLGLWRSRRQYFFPDDEVLRVDMLLRVETFVEPVHAEPRYRFTWWPEKDYDFFERKPRYVREGVMDAFLCGHQLRRNRGYLCGSPTKSQIRQVDEHEVVFESHYQQWDILEHIRLVDQDRYRARSIYSWSDGNLELAEIHHEIRLEGPGAPLPPED